MILLQQAILWDFWISPIFYKKVWTSCWRWNRSLVGSWLAWAAYSDRKNSWIALWITFSAKCKKWRKHLKRWMSTWKTRKKLLSLPCAFPNFYLCTKLRDWSNSWQNLILTSIILSSIKFCFLKILAKCVFQDQKCRRNT